MKRSYDITISLSNPILEDSKEERRLVKWMSKQDYSFGWSEASQSIKRHLHIQIWITDKYKMPKDVKNYIARNIFKDLSKDECKHGLFVVRAYDCWDKNYYESDKKTDQTTTQIFDARPTSSVARSYYDRQSPKSRGSNLPTLKQLEVIYKEMVGDQRPSIGQVADFLAQLFVKERRFDIPADPRRCKALATQFYHFMNPDTSYLMFLPQDPELSFNDLKLISNK